MPHCGCRTRSYAITGTPMEMEVSAGVELTENCVLEQMHGLLTTEMILMAEVVVAG